jgi:beta-phosphoglucomutase-like phosphatase (HAD superfamily)
LVIFDCDGVLVDTERQVAVVTSDYLEERGLSLSAEDAAVLFKGLANAEIEGLAEAMLGAPLPGNFVAEIDQRLVDAMSLGITVVPGVGEAIQAIVAAGCAVCVGSNGSLEETDVKVNAAGFRGWFGGSVFSAHHVERGKPAPDLFLFAAATMGFAPGDCGVIEDSATGVRAAVGAGMRVLGYAPEGDSQGLRDLGAEVLVSMGDVVGLTGL